MTVNNLPLESNDEPNQWIDPQDGNQVQKTQDFNMPMC